MGGLLSTQKTPDVKAPEPLPQVDETLVQKARRRAAAATSQRAGVASTYQGYSGRDSDKLG